MKLEIQSALIPGTVMYKEKMGNVTGLEFLDKIFYITDGIMLSQIREISGIDGSTLQNWTKRGWVANAHNKRYNKNQLARILIINMMRDSMQLERIAQLLTYVNGVAGDTSDDIIPESELYDYLCRVIDVMVSENGVSDGDSVKEESVKALIHRTLESYEERAAGARSRLEKACGIIIFAYYATLVRHKANSMFDTVFGTTTIR
ncbi:MAG: DUF1836 domain-containing protein [Clostridia bacterium]|nr:DUF1836 domain-containing protein [Clostridia bacterium]